MVGWSKVGIISSNKLRTQEARGVPHARARLFLTARGNAVKTMSRKYGSLYICLEYLARHRAAPGRSIYYRGPRARIGSRRVAKYVNAVGFLLRNPLQSAGNDGVLSRLLEVAGKKRSYKLEFIRPEMSKRHTTECTRVLNLKSQVRLVNSIRVTGLNNFISSAIGRAYRSKHSLHVR